MRTDTENVSLTPQQQRARADREKAARLAVSIRDFLAETATTRRSLRFALQDAEDELNIMANGGSA